MTEQVPDTFPALFMGYAAIWILICGYLFYLVARLRKIEAKNNYKN